MEEKLLGTEKIYKLFIKFAIPGVMGMVIMGLYTIIDGVFLGNFVGPEALASINIVMPYIGLLIALCLMISIGCQSIIGIKLGEKNYTDARNAFKTGLIALGVGSVVMAFFTFIFSEQIAYVLGARGNLTDNVVDYLRVTSIFLPCWALMYLLDYTIRAIGRPVFAMVVGSTAMAINIILDYIFIAKLGLGVKGGALGTGIAYVIGFLIFMVPFMKKKDIINFSTGVFDKKILWNSLYNGSSEGITEVAEAITTFSFNLVLMKYVGEYGVAAFSIISYISIIGVMILLGVSEGIRPIVGYNYGYKNPKRILKVLKISIITAMTIGTTIFLFLFFKGEMLISIFLDNSNEQVIALAKNGAKIYSFAFLMNSLNILGSGYFTSIGNPKNSVIISSLRGIILIIIGLTLLPLIFGINGIWMTVPVSELLVLAVTSILVTRSLRGLMKVN